MTFVLHLFVNNRESLPVLMSLGTMGSGGEVEFLEWQVVSALWRRRKTSAEEGARVAEMPRKLPWPLVGIP